MVFAARPARASPARGSASATITARACPLPQHRSPARALSRRPSAARTRERVRAGGPLILAAIFIAFAVLNLNQVKVDWIVGSGHAPLIIVIVISVLVGIVLTHFAERVGRKRR